MTESRLPGPRWQHVPLARRVPARESPHLFRRSAQPRTGHRAFRFSRRRRRERDQAGHHPSAWRQAIRAVRDPCLFGLRGPDPSEWRPPMCTPVVHSGVGIRPPLFSSIRSRRSSSTDLSILVYLRPTGNPKSRSHTAYPRAFNPGSQARGEAPLRFRVERSECGRIRAR